jgi:hypothetical protein
VPALLAGTLVVALFAWLLRPPPASVGVNPYGDHTEGGTLNGTPAAPYQFTYHDDDARQAVPVAVIDVSPVECGSAPCGSAPAFVPDQWTNREDRRAPAPDNRGCTYASAAGVPGEGCDRRGH